MRTRTVCVSGVSTASMLPSRFAKADFFTARSQVYLTSAATSSRPLSGARFSQRTPLRSVMV
jgi:hypothetical protein